MVTVGKSTFSIGHVVVSTIVIVGLDCHAEKLKIQARIDKNEQELTGKDKKNCEIQNIQYTKVRLCNEGVTIYFQRVFQSIFLHPQFSVIHFFTKQLSQSNHI